MRQEKLVITATVAPSWIYPEARNNPGSPDQAVEEAVNAWKAGAAIVHIHGKKNFSKEEWKSIIRSLRDKTDVIIQVGLSALPVQDRLDVIGMKPDMISIILNHHDEAFPETEMSMLHNRDELEQYARLCAKHKIRPEWEVWHAGSVWNLNYLANKGLVNPPYFVTLFFDWPGGIWSPATFEELTHRLRQQIAGSICSISVMSHAQTQIAFMSMLLGHHVRVGTEDNPYYSPTRLATDNGELVARIMRIAKEIGRDVANPKQAREMIAIENS